jgi:hypothetical protein
MHSLRFVNFPQLMAEWLGLAVLYLDENNSQTGPSNTTAPNLVNNTGLAKRCLCRRNHSIGWCFGYTKLAMAPVMSSGRRLNKPLMSIDSVKSPQSCIHIASQS